MCVCAYTQGLTGLFSNPVLANAVSGLATSACSFATSEVCVCVYVCITMDSLTISDIARSPLMPFCPGALGPCKDTGTVISRLVLNGASEVLGNCHL